MKKFLLTLLLALGAATRVVFGQAAPAPDPKLEAQLFAMEKAGWEAWRRQDAAWFEANLPADFTNLSGATKAEFLKGALNSCQVEHYEFERMKLTLLTPDAALLTYAVTQRGTCGGKVFPPKLHAASNYARRNGKWQWVALMEMHVTK